MSYPMKQHIITILDMTPIFLKKTTKMKISIISIDKYKDNKKQINQRDVTANKDIKDKVFLTQIGTHLCLTRSLIW